MNRLIKKITALAMAVAMSTAAMSVVADAAWVKTDTGYKYQNEDGSYAKSKWINAAKGIKYYIKNDGTMAKGLLKLKSSGTTDYYYFDKSGVMQIGWQSVDGSVYYFKSTGKAVRGKNILIGEYSYKFDSKGVWDGKVYSKDGKKDVTSTVNVAKLVPVTIEAESGSSENKIGKVKKVKGEIPETITIKGQTYRTGVNNSFVGDEAQPVYPEGGEYTQWTININGCTDADLECLKYLPNLEDLTLIAYDPKDKKTNEPVGSYDDNYSLITNLDFVYYMPKLKYLTIEGAPYLTDVSGVSVCKNLQSVHLDSCGMKELTGWEKLTKIKDFYAYNTRLENINGLVNCKNLKHCEVIRAYLTDITGLSNKNRLWFVALDANRRLQDITPLATCENLERVYLNSCTSVNTWDTVLQLNNLDSVAMLYLPTSDKTVVNVSNQLEEKGVIAGYDGSGKRHWQEDVPHLERQEYYINAIWDKEMRPKSVHGDDTNCPCSYCKRTKYDSVAQDILSKYE